VKQGLLRKQGGQYKSWKDRWFTLTKDSLAYYKSHDVRPPPPPPLSSYSFSLVAVVLDG